MDQASSRDRRAEALAEARAWIGTPYHHQASLKGVGVDCLGLIRGVYRAIIGPEPAEAPPYTPDWGESAGRELLFEACAAFLHPVEVARPGDVLLFRLKPAAVAKHVGVLSAGDARAGRMIHAHEGVGVIEQDLGGFWSRRLVAAFAFAPAGG